MAKKDKMSGHRDAKGRFVKGNPGGPGGPRRKAYELRQAVDQAVSAEHIAAVVRKATRLALEGDMQAARFVLDRTCGRAPEAPAQLDPVDLSLPPLQTAEDCNQAISLVIDRICEGGVDRDVAKILISSIETRVKTIETVELERRLAQLEQAADLTLGDQS